MPISFDFYCAAFFLKPQIDLIYKENIFGILCDEAQQNIN